jgi:hypothetical protein
MSFDAPHIVGSRHIPPDPSIARAIGRRHSFDTAVADLVDNSIDAEAQNVFIRFLQHDDVIVGLRVIDDGRGMDAVALEGAMTYAKQREYSADALGHFGVGLKAASLSQADELRVYTRRFASSPAGAAIEAAEPTRVGLLSADDVEAGLAIMRRGLPGDAGTVVEWARPRTFLSVGANRADRARWLEDRIGSLASHLGVVFHRMLADERVRIVLDVVDLGSGESGAPRIVAPVDPFGYTAPAGSRYPTQLRLEIAGRTSTARAHIWPAAQSGSPSFRLGGRPGALAQGLFFYRHDRLVQAGGWNTLVVTRPELEYARVEIDLDDVLASHVSLNPEKSGLELDDDLRAAIRASTLPGLGIGFDEFVAEAEGTRRESRRYTKTPVTLMLPDWGFGADMRGAIEDSVDIHDSGGIGIRWRVMASESPFEVDVDERTIWLNEQYRSVIVGRDSLDPDDAPLLKTLMLIVFSKYFEGAYLGSKEKVELEAWRQLLTAALRDEIAQQARRWEESS